MYLQANKQQENTRHSSQDGFSRLQNENTSALRFMNNRSEAISQLQQVSQSGQQVQQLMAYQSMADAYTTQRQEKPNNTGLPDQLKTGIESLSGMSMDHVKVHYNSDKPAQLNAHAYAQGSEIHVARGQEKHVPHEAWHVVQQAQGRVKPTMQLKAGVPVNDDSGLEREADIMGAKALNTGSTGSPLCNPVLSSTNPVQCYTYGADNQTRKVKVTGAKKDIEFEECTKNSVEFKAGDALPDTGTGTSEAAWAGWLTSKDSGNNATQLHVVNKKWGGLGETDGKNLVPGTHAQNMAHLHQAEKKFKNCFDNSNKAINDCKYVCEAQPDYGQNINVNGKTVEHDDPKLIITITDNNVTNTYPVDRQSKVVFKDGG
jgi:Domain of unknown function (DUF4157)